MCGISGIFAYHDAAPEVAMDELARITEHMAPRGPDGAGTWRDGDGRIALGHRRLAVIDPTPRAAQPMASADGRYVISCNGEIYNFRELRHALGRGGEAFRTASDTEVVLALYARHGLDMLKRLRGMFALAIWDTHERRLLLARDAFGVKPLYYADDGWSVRFASQVKALLAGGRVSAGVDCAGLAGFYLYGSVPEPFTIRAAVRAVPAGGYLCFDGLGPRAARRWFEPSALLAAGADAEHRSPARRRRVQRALLDSVRAHMVADVAVGVFLSAGVDSGALLGLLHDLGHRRVPAVTLRFDEYAHDGRDESAGAVELARRYQARHRLRRVDRAEFERDLPAILARMDQPSIDGVNAWFVSKASAEMGVRVALSGIGADELFGGYPAFRRVPRLLAASALPARVPGLGRLVRAAGAPLAELLGLHPKLCGLLEYGAGYADAYLLQRAVYMPWDLGRLMGPEMAREGLRRLRPVALLARSLDPDPGTSRGRLIALECGQYLRNQLLRDSDWAGMAHSVEIRTPFVDAALFARLAPTLATLTGVEGKRLLAAAPAHPLPAARLGASKTGFNVPLERWSGLGAGVAGTGPALRAVNTRWARRWARQLARLAHA